VSTLATALIAAQKDMPAVEKTAKANYGKYATLDNIIAKTRSVLNKHGLSIVQFPVLTDTGGPGLQTTITHSSGESITSVMPLFLGKQDMQNLGSAITYARRYAWAAALGISAEPDTDGHQSPVERVLDGATPPVDDDGPDDSPVMVTFDQKGKYTQILKEIAGLREETPAKVRAAVHRDIKAFDDMTAAEADALLAKLITWKGNLENEKAAA
jgi:hypothetical protein